jgi:hypothetical protein
MGTPPGHYEFGTLKAHTHQVDCCRDSTTPIRPISSRHCPNYDDPKRDRRNSEYVAGPLNPIQDVERPRLLAPEQAFGFSENEGCG